MSKINQKQNWIFALMFASIFVVSMFSGYTSNISFAETTYSSVVEDLQKDESFNVEDYPIVKDDYSLKVLTIAESVNDELFVYVYQPSGNLTASSINISTKIDTPSYTNYGLTLLDKDSSLQKYKVNNFEIEDSTIRYYEITTIYRPFNAEYDKELDNGNTINYVDFSVGKRYEFNTTENGLTINTHDIDVIDIAEKYVGFVRYDDGYTGSPGLGFAWNEPGYDSHFIAFSTASKIDKLMEAEIYYTSQTYSYYKSLTSTQERYGDLVENKATPTYKDKVEVSVEHGLIKYNYNWDRIQTVDEFISTEDRSFIYECGLFKYNVSTNITDEGLEDLKGKDWVVRFTETEWSDTFYSTNIFNKTYVAKKTIIGNVSILRLKFETDGITYNLGAVDNMQTGDGVPDNETKGRIEFSWWLLAIIGIPLLILAIIYLPGIVRIVFKGIFKFIVSILKCLWYVWTAPLSLFGWDD